MRKLLLIIIIVAVTIDCTVRVDIIQHIAYGLAMIYTSYRLVLALLGRHEE